ncbi:hypothetical protein [uncultured Psychroserpens sp.]|uniref:hypothetical protein n=1 Tax=uncultured Psychroserpens sp. TaxID=255436 RepID=UPI00262BFBAF|nr:hypothetical protein [uncultured Psychroserpens sp.]
MKTIGFIKPHDKHNEAKYLSEYLEDGYENNDKEAILNYLNKGVLCIDWMEWLFEDESDDAVSIGPNTCNTDGIWIWPNYLEYYLNKYPNFKLDQEFIDYVNENQDKSVDVSNEENIKIQEAYQRLTNSKTDKGTSLIDEDEN